MAGNTKRKGRKRPENSKGKTARDRILEAAYDVFVEHGFSGATTDMIQAASATSKATMYAHFRSKETLFHEMVEYRLSQSLLEFRELSNENDSIEEFLLMLGYELLRNVLDEDGVKLGRLMIAESTRFPLLGTLFNITGPKAITDIVEMRLSEANRRKELDVPEPELAAEQFAGIIKGDYYLRALLGYEIPPGKHIKRYVEKSVAAFLKAYALKVAESKAPSPTANPV